MSTSARPARAMPSPDPVRPPLRVNLFDAMAKANTALVPLFPYLGPGCIVPTGNAFRGGGGRDFGVFEHFNTVDEVAICFGARGARIRAGQVAAGAKRHNVGGFFPDLDDSASYVLISVTQRQADADVPQHEEMNFFCEKCRHRLVHHAYDAKPKTAPGIMPGGYELYVDTIVEAANSLDRFNADEAARRCPNCGHECRPFPVELWGWREYREKLALVRECWREYGGATADAAE
jgi:hypothetical protein